MDEQLSKYLVKVCYRFPTVEVEAVTEEDAIDKAFEKLQSHSQAIDEIERAYDIDDMDIEYFNGVHLFVDEVLNVDIVLEVRDAKSN